MLAQRDLELVDLEHGRIRVRDHPFVLQGTERDRADKLLRFQDVRDLLLVHLVQEQRLPLSDERRLVPLALVLAVEQRLARNSPFGRQLLDPGDFAIEDFDLLRRLE